MRDIYKTAKKAQMAPVRGRVKAMMAQPRAVAQARKVARQTTGFAKGGITDSPTKVINRLLSDEKGKPHSTTEGKEASIKRLTKRVLDRYIKKGQQQGLNPADVRSAIDLVGSSKGSFKDFFEKAKKKQAGGHVKKASHKWTAEQFGGGEKGKPHSTQEGRIAAGERLFKRFWDKKKEEDKKRKMGPQAPARPKEAGMYVKKGGVMEKGKPHSTTEGKISAIQRKYKRALANIKDKGRLTARDIERAEKLTKSFGKQSGWKKEDGRWVQEHPYNAVDKMLKILKKEPSLVGKKKGGKVDKKWIQKAVNPKHKGYCTPMSKPTCTPRRKALAKLFKSKAKKGWAKGGSPGEKNKYKPRVPVLGKDLKRAIWKIKGQPGAVKKANGGTVVMPTVGNDVRTRAYKEGALIHPRPRPTTVLHGRERGVGIAKRGW